jgi:hypothetical protein
MFQDNTSNVIEDIQNLIKEEEEWVQLLTSIEKLPQIAKGVC